MSLLLKELYRPGLKVTEVAASAAQAWKGFSEGEKQKYILQAREIGQQRRDEFERLSDERQYELESEAKQLISSRKKRARRAKIRDLHASTGHPKRPPTAYTIFTKEHFQQSPKPKNRDESTEIIKAAAEAWKNLSESEKDTYQQRARPAMEQYRNEVEQWKQDHKPEKKVVKKVASSPRNRTKKGKVKAKKNTTTYRHFRDKKKKGEQLRQKKELEEATLGDMLPSVGDSGGKGGKDKKKKK